MLRNIVLVLVESLSKSWVVVAGLMTKSGHKLGTTFSVFLTYTNPGHRLYKRFSTARSTDLPSVSLLFCTQSPALINKTVYLKERL